MTVCDRMSLATICLPSRLELKAREWVEDRESKPAGQQLQYLGSCCFDCFPGFAAAPYGRSSFFWLVQANERARGSMHKRCSFQGDPQKLSKSVVVFSFNANRPLLRLGLRELGVHGRSDAHHVSKVSGGKFEAWTTGRSSGELKQSPRRGLSG